MSVSVHGGGQAAFNPNLPIRPTAHSLRWAFHQAKPYRPSPDSYEDVGGVSGYERFLKTIADGEDPEHAETSRWCGGYFDPEWSTCRSWTRMFEMLCARMPKGDYQPKPKAFPKK
nr:plasmid pRiA4b ORF-3 family protein [Agrobacterium vitis]